MTYSANEVTNLAARAARGGGAAPVQAALFGRAALCHLIAGRDAAALVAALEALPLGPITALPVLFEELQENALAGKPAGQITGNHPAPLITSFVEAQPFLTMIERRQDALWITTDLHTPVPHPDVSRVEAPPALIAQMQTLAARLLVPESDASRRSGAGAGLTDND